jgi:hypothetical protein
MHAPSTISAAMVVSTSRSAPCAAVAHGEALNRATLLPWKFGLPTSQSSMFLKAPGIPLAYSGQEISSASHASMRARRARTMAGGSAQGRD